MGENFALTLAPPKKITVVKKFFTELKTPYAATRTEMVTIPVQLFNAASSDEEAFMKVDFDEDMLVLVGNAERDFKIAAKDVHVEKFTFRVIGIGSTKVTATAASKTNADLSDAMEKTFKLKAEGIAKQASFTSFKCGKSSKTIPTVYFNELKSDPPTTAEVVEDSVRVQLSLTDNLFGSAMDNLDSLVIVPYGCGEQNMVGVVPNIAVANFLPKDDSTRAKAIKNAQHGYDRELNYQREDGSFSAFGDSDSEGSSWLTAFVVRVFMEGKDYIKMDYEKSIIPAVDWLLKPKNYEKVPNELDNYPELTAKELKEQVKDQDLIKFPLKGRLFHPLFQEQEGVYTDMHMTVTALMALQRVVDANVYPKKSVKIKDIISRGWGFIKQAAIKSCKEKNAGNKNSPCSWEKGMNVPIYVLGHVMYAARVSNKKMLVNKLTKYFKSQQTVENNMIYWKAKPGAKKCTDYWDCYYNASNDVELTSYYLLSTLTADNISMNDRKIMRYLQSKRNSKGGWSSTQDTMMAMSALSVFAQRMGAAASKDKKFNFKIGKVKKETQINAGNTGVVQIFEAPRGDRVSNVMMKGSGCVLAQTTVFYNIKEIEEDKNLELSYDAAKGCFLTLQYGHSV